MFFVVTNLRRHEKSTILIVTNLRWHFKSKFFDVMNSQQRLWTVAFKKDHFRHWSTIRLAAESSFSEGIVLHNQHNVVKLDVVRHGWPVALPVGRSSGRHDPVATPRPFFASNSLTSEAFRRVHPTSSWFVADFQQLLPDFAQSPLSHLVQVQSNQVEFSVQLDPCDQRTFPRAICASPDNQCQW